MQILNSLGTGLKFCIFNKSPGDTWYSQELHGDTKSVMQNLDFHYPGHKENNKKLIKEIKETTEFYQLIRN